jgi:hypothetical protein
MTWTVYRCMSQSHQNILGTKVNAAPKENKTAVNTDNHLFRDRNVKTGDGA